MSQPERILLGHLASFGDCLYATAVARQIKQDFPGCHLTWAIGSMFRAAILENPFVDAVWEYPMTERREIVTTWAPFVREARRRLRRGDFTGTFFTQIAPGNYQNFDGTVRPSIFRGYPGPITVPIAPVLRLGAGEVERVHAFAERSDLSHQRHVVLFECGAASGQSFVTPDFALSVARILVGQMSDCVIILSSNVTVTSGHERILDASSLTVRENAELSRYCSLLVGGSSGISWICTSDWAKPLPMIQLLRGSTSMYASMLYDAEYFGLPTGNILEMTESTAAEVAGCIRIALTEGFPVARERYHRRLPVDLSFYFRTFVPAILKQGEPLKALRSMRLVQQRFGSAPFRDYVSGLFKDL